MAIVANKHRGVHACVVDDLFSSERAQIVNNSKLIAMGAGSRHPCSVVRSSTPGSRVVFTQKMEFRKEFLTNAFNKVVEVEGEQSR